MDLGGPRREFFRLFASGSRKYFFKGSDTRQFFYNNASALQVKYYLYDNISHVQPVFIHLYNSALSVL